MTANCRRLHVEAKWARPGVGAFALLAPQQGGFSARKTDDGRYKRNGTTQLLAALTMLDDTSVARRRAICGP